MTDKELIKVYFYGSETETDWNVGSPILFSGNYEGTFYQDKGIILQSEKEKLFAYSYWSSMGGTDDIAENYATITYMLKEEGPATKLTVEQKGFNNKQAYEHSIQGWKDVLNNLKKLLEK